MAWPGIGAALATTWLSVGTVTAPGQRYHPAIVGREQRQFLEAFGETVLPQLRAA